MPVSLCRYTMRRSHLREGCLTKGRCPHTSITNVYLAFFISDACLNPLTTAVDLLQYSTLRDEFQAEVQQGNQSIYSNTLNYRYSSVNCPASHLLAVIIFTRCFHECNILSTHFFKQSCKILGNLLVAHCRI